MSPADPAGVRWFWDRFGGRELEIALEATTGWRFVVEEFQRGRAEVHLAKQADTRTVARSEEAREGRPRGRPASAAAG